MQYPNKSARVAKCLLGIGVLALPLWCQVADNQGAREVTIHNSHFVPHGDVLTRGTNNVPTGKHKVKSYRLERIQLSQPLIAGRAHLQYNYLLRLVVSGERFKNSNYTIWVNDRPFSAITNLDSSEIYSDFPGGPNLLESDATLSVSEGGNPCAFREDDESILPEKLSVPTEIRAVAFESNPVRLRSIARSSKYNGKPAVAITVTTRHMLADGRNELPAIQIGKRYFLGGGLLHDFSTQIPADDFFLIPENSQIFVHWGRCANGGEFVGRLHKGDLDR